VVLQFGLRVCRFGGFCVCCWFVRLLVEFGVGSR